MTRDELSQLSFKELVELIMRLQSDVARLQLRLVEFERRQPRTAQPEPAPVIPSPNALREPILHNNAMEDHIRIRRMRRHRPWHRRLLQVLAPSNPRVSAVVAVVVIGVVVLSIVAAVTVNLVGLPGRLRLP